MDASLIEQTCNQTPYPDLCVSTLQSDPQSAEADPKALDVLDKALVLVVKEPGNQPVKACANTYQEVLGTNIPQANEDFPKGESKIAALAIINVVQKSDSCESGFPGGSPFKYKSKVVHDVAYVASAIAKLINS
ncbi:unnamed protein product [Malus baccata var. baccata]